MAAPGERVKLEQEQVMKRTIGDDGDDGDALVQKWCKPHKVDQRWVMQLCDKCSQERQTGGSQYCEMLSQVYGGTARPGYQWVKLTSSNWENYIVE